MQTQTLRAKVDANGILKLQLPATTANQELDIVIVFQSAPEPTQAQSDPEKLGYSRKFLDEIIGGWQGEPLERPAQLPWEAEEELLFGKVEQ
ncbi:MAG: hypothetical protein F6J87_28495 [Spirulina sp. SIO3F2]|nr:hypothetical protein [Spirulina sp. SIO3F2]